MRILTLFIFAIVLMGPVVSSQEKKRVIIYPPYATRTAEKTGPAGQAAITDAVEIVSIEVGGRAVKIGEPFEADDDWLQSFAVKLKNISGRNISGVQMSFVVPETGAPDRAMLMLPLRFGTSANSKKSGVTTKLAAADEEFQMKLTPSEYEREKNLILQTGLTTGVLKLWIGPTMVTFEDGKHWSAVCLKSSDANSACQ